MYPDDLFFLTKKIYIRRVEDRIITMGDSAYGMADEEGREKMLNRLNDQLDRLKGIDKVGRNEKLDRAGLARLKEQLSKHSKSIKVK